MSFLFLQSRDAFTSLLFLLSIFKNLRYRSPGEAAHHKRREVNIAGAITWPFFLFLEMQKQILLHTKKNTTCDNMKRQLKAAKNNKGFSSEKILTIE